MATFLSLKDLGKTALNCLCCIITVGCCCVPFFPENPSHVISLAEARAWYYSRERAEAEIRARPPLSLSPGDEKTVEVKASTANVLTHLDIVAVELVITSPTSEKSSIPKIDEPAASQIAAAESHSSSAAESSDTSPEPSQSEAPKLHRPI